MTDEIEIEFEDAKKGVKLKLKGKSDVVSKYIEKYGYETAMKEAVNRQDTPTPSSFNKKDQPKKPMEIPEKPKAETLTEYIQALMYSKWGVVGRTSSEIAEVGQAHSISLPPSTLSGILHGLNKAGKLKRQKEAGGQWKYYPPLAVSMKL